MIFVTSIFSRELPHAPFLGALFFSGAEDDGGAPVLGEPEPLTAVDEKGTLLSTSNNLIVICCC
jgi:hypothetical protein